MESCGPNTSLDVMTALRHHSHVIARMADNPQGAHFQRPSFHVILSQSHESLAFPITESEQ